MKTMTFLFAIGLSLIAASMFLGYAVAPTMATLALALVSTVSAIVSLVFSFCLPETTYTEPNRKRTRKQIAREIHENNTAPLF